MDGQPIKLHGTLTLKLQIESSLLPVLFHITAGDHIPPILGLNVMRQRKHMRIDFTGDSGTVSFGQAKNTLDMSSQNSTPVISRITQGFRVTLKENCKIPARHEAIIQGRLVADSRETLLSAEGKQIIVEPKNQLGEDSICARSVCCVRTGVIPLRVCNPFNKEITLQQGCLVGQAEVLPDSPVVAALSEVDKDIEMMTADSKASCDDQSILQKMSEEAEVTTAEKEVTADNG